MSLLLVMVIFGIIESVLMMAGKPSWFLLSTGGDSIGAVYGEYSILLGEILPHELPFEIETIDIGLAATAMAVYLVVGFILSVWITKRRQLA